MKTQWYLIMVKAISKLLSSCYRLLARFFLRQYCKKNKCKKELLDKMVENKVYATKYTNYFCNVPRQYSSFFQNCQDLQTLD